MKTQENIARTELIYMGSKLVYGSHEELLAIGHILNKRDIEYNKTIISIAEKPESVDSNLKSLMFPHIYYNDIAKSLKAKAFFQKTRDLELYIKPLG